jgi:protein TonB
MMFARYTSAISSGAIMTFALLFVMQSLITMQPGIVIDTGPSNFVEFIKRRIVDTPLQPVDPIVDKKKLTKTVLPPTRATSSGPRTPVHVFAASPTPPVGTGRPTIGVITDGALINMVRVAPVYPSRALAYGIEGYVVVQFDVTADGRVVNVVIIESTDSVFNKAAIRAAGKFKFKPRVVDGLALASYGIRNMFSFEIEE